MTALGPSSFMMIKASQRTSTWTN